MNILNGGSHADNSIDWMIGFKRLSGADFELHFKTEKEKRVWEFRIALLDILYYSPKG